jgi:hypothetical protein
MTRSFTGNSIHFRFVDLLEAMKSNITYGDWELLLLRGASDSLIPLLDQS